MNELPSLGTLEPSASTADGRLILKDGKALAGFGNGEIDTIV